MKKKILSVLLVLTMVLTLTPTVAFAATYGDTNGHWAESSIDRWSDTGVVQGTGAGEFNPNGDMSRAEAAQIFANLLRLKETTSISGYSDVDTSAWYADAVSKCVAAGILKGTGGNTMSPGMTVTREQTFVMIARALGIEEQTSSEKTFNDAGEVSGWASGYVNALINMGVIGGVDDRHIAPGTDIDRASVMTVLDRLIGGYGYENGQTVEIVKGKITLVVADDVKLSGEADPDLPIIIAGEASKVDLKDVTGQALVQVNKDNVAIENAPVGTEIKAEGVENVTANGIDVSGDPNQNVVIPEPEPEKKPPTSTRPPSSGGGGYEKPASTHTVYTLPPEDGSATVDVSTTEAEQGEIVTVTVRVGDKAPSEGGNARYIVQAINIKNGNRQNINEQVKFNGGRGGINENYVLDEGQYIFEMPNEDVWIEVVTMVDAQGNCAYGPDNNCLYPSYNCEATPEAEPGEEGKGTEVNDPQLKK